MHNREMVPKWIKNLASSLFVSFVYHLHICKFLMSPPVSKMSPSLISPYICCPPLRRGDNFELPPPPPPPPPSIVQTPVEKPGFVCSIPLSFLSYMLNKPSTKTSRFL